MGGGSDGKKNGNWRSRFFWPRVGAFWATGCLRNFILFGAVVLFRDDGKTGDVLGGPKLGATLGQGVVPFAPTRLVWLRAELWSKPPCAHEGVDPSFWVSPGRSLYNTPIQLAVSLFNRTGPPKQTPGRLIRIKAQNPPHAAGIAPPEPGASTSFALRGP